MSSLFLKNLIEDHIKYFEFTLKDLIESDDYQNAAKSMMPVEFDKPKFPRYQRRTIERLINDARYRFLNNMKYEAKVKLNEKTKSKPPISEHDVGRQLSSLIKEIDNAYRPY